MDRSRRSLSALSLAIVGLSLLLAVWEAFIYIVKPLPSALPSPLAVLEQLQSLAMSAEFYADVGVSLQRVVIGFLIATVTGILTGLSIGYVSWIRRLIQPSLDALRFVVPFAWIPLASVVFGLSETGKVFITWYAAYFVIVFNTSAGVRSCDPLLEKAARTLGSNGIGIMWRVILPASVPGILTGLRIGIALSWISLLAAEMVNANSGLGHFILAAGTQLQSDSVIAGMAVIGVLGYAMNALSSLMEKRFSFTEGGGAS